MPCWVVCVFVLGLRVVVSLDVKLVLGSFVTVSSMTYTRSHIMLPLIGSTTGANHADGRHRTVEVFA